MEFPYITKNKCRHWHSQIGHRYGLTSYLVAHTGAQFVQIICELIICIVNCQVSRGICIILTTYASTDQPNQDRRTMVDEDCPPKKEIDRLDVLVLMPR